MERPSDPFGIGVGGSSGEDNNQQRQQQPQHLQLQLQSPQPPQVHSNGHATTQIIMNPANDPPTATPTLSPPTYEHHHQQQQQQQQGAQELPPPSSQIRFTTDQSGDTVRTRLVPSAGDPGGGGVGGGVSYGRGVSGRTQHSAPPPATATAIDGPRQFSSIGRRSQNRSSFISTSDIRADNDGPGVAAFLLTALSVLLIIVTMPFSLCLVIKVVTEYERAVIFRLGRLRKGGSKGPGIFTVIPCIDNYRCVDLRTVSFDVPPQEILSRDSVTVTVDAVVYFNVIDAEQALCSVDDFSHSTRLLAATTLRNVLGTKNLAEILSERETISHIMQTSLDEATDPWGVKVERVEIKDVRLPVQLQRAMAAEAEAAREARAKVIAAEGEQKASRALKEAADVIQESPAALQLRYLQTLTSISAEKNSTIIFPLPIDVMSHFFK